MLSSHSDPIHLAELLDAADRIGMYVHGWSLDDFISDLRTVDAVCMNLIRIGEAARRLSPELKARLADVPWTDIIRNRDRIARGYAQLSVLRIYETATEAVPDLAIALRGITPRHD